MDTYLLGLHAIFTVIIGNETKMIIDIKFLLCKVATYLDLLHCLHAIFTVTICNETKMLIDI